MLPPDELERLRQKLIETYGLKIKPKRIRALRVNSSYRWQPPLHIEVGKTCSDLERDGSPELIVAIFESTAFMVCTKDHGVEAGMPHFFSRQDVRQVIESD